MTSRREFMKAGFAASTLPIVARADFAAAEATPLYKVLYDTRFPASVAFARGAEAAGLAVHAMAGDMTRFWYEDLYYRWRQGPVAIAGLTAHGALFCLERLGWEQRMRVVYRGEHAPAAPGRVAHRFTGPAALLPGAVEAAGDPAWAVALAGVVAECPRGPLQVGAAQAVTAATALAPSSEALFSWVIAPVARA
jgi:hypothetical protein